MDMPEIDIEHWEKVTKALEFFGAIGLASMGYLVGKWRHHRENTPRAQIVLLKSENETLRKLIGEITANVASNSGNIDDLFEQVGAIQGDNERYFERELRPLREDVARLDDRLFNMAGGTLGVARRLTSAGRRERGNDPGN